MLTESLKLREAYAAWELARQNGDPREAELWLAYVRLVEAEMGRIALEPVRRSG